MTAATLFPLLADATRRDLLAFLRQPRTVAQLSTLMDCEANSLHHHLHTLEAAGLIHCVGESREGARPARVWQRVDPAGNGGRTVPPELAPVLNRAALNALDAVRKSILRALAKESGRVVHRRLRVHIRPQDRAACEAAVLRHLDALREELSEIETVDGGEVYTVFAVHFPGGGE